MIFLPVVSCMRVFDRKGANMYRLLAGAIAASTALSVLLILPTTSGAQQRPPILEKLTKTYGLESFGQIQAIRYSFTAEAPGINISRSWTWEPKTDQVTYEGKDKSGNPVKVTYLRSQLASQPTNVRDDIDPDFVNDNYWLAPPISFFLGQQRCGRRCRRAETAAGKWFR